MLTTLLRNDDDLHLPPDVVLREICFFLLAGAHTSATAFVRTLHNVFAMADDRPEDFERACTDLAFLQRCVHETVRLQPSSPIAMRWALADIDLPDGVHVPTGARLTIDLMAANRDPEAFGDDADAFDPHRVLGPGVAPWGLSFGLGMHACIGQDLAAGLDPMGRPVDDDHLYGLVPVAIRALLDAGGRPDPADPPTMDPDSSPRLLGSLPGGVPDVIDLHAHVVLEQTLGAAGRYGPELDEGDAGAGRLPCYRVGDYELRRRALPGQRVHGRGPCASARWTSSASTCRSSRPTR